MRADIAVLLVIGSLLGPAGTRAEPPAATGDLRPAGAAVEQVAKQKQQLVKVPDVVHLTRQQAEATLLKSGLRVGTVTEVPPDPDSSVGAVIWQDPIAGTPVVPGRAVNIRVVGQWPATQELKTLKAIPVLPLQKPQPTTVSVPDLFNLTIVEARERLVQAKLQLGAVEGPKDAPIEPGTVLRVVSQFPLAGDTVDPNTRVRITVRQPVEPPPPPPPPPVQVQVPDLFGAGENDVAPILDKARLALGQVRRLADTRPRGTVIRQRPQAGTWVSEGRPVDVVVVDPQMTFVPALVDRTLADAGQMCVNAGLQLASVQEESHATEGTIVSQKPPAGARVALGSTVNVVLAVAAVAPPPPNPPPNPPPPNPPPEELVVVPDLTGLLLADAQRVTASIGLGTQLTSEMTEGDADNRRIVSQDPAPRSRIKRGTLVAVGLGAPPPPFPWPLVGGALVAAGLLGALAWWWFKPPTPVAPLLRVDVTGSSPACELEAGGGLIDVEMRIDVKREPGWPEFDVTGASIIRETGPGAR